jgi:hypothetical protein
MLGIPNFFLNLMSLLPFRKRVDLHPVVRRLLELAVDQRSIMLVEFTDHDLTSGRFFGPCAAFDEHTVLVDVSLHKNFPEWAGTGALVSFKIDSKGTSSYYQFTATLQATPRRTGGFGMLLNAPAEIVPNQKRSFVRVSPRREMTFGVGIWSLKDTQARPSEPASLGAAHASYRQDHPEHLALLNVSAGGLCLKLRRLENNQTPLDPQPGDRLLCLLMLRSQEGARLLPFWLDCAVMNRTEMQSEPYSILGLRFRSWAMPIPGKEKIDWFTVGDEGAVGPLGAWVLHQQLVQLRQKRTR